MSRSLGKIVVGALFVAAAVSARADDGAITGVGGTISLLDEHKGISLVAERVSATVHVAQDEIEVECLFVLRNAGAADTVQVGFPEFYTGYDKAVPFIFFESAVDGAEVACVRVEGKPGSGGNVEHWWIRELAFGAGETRIVRDRYRAPAGITVGDSKGAFSMFDYTLYTGASWAGDIAAATIEITIDECPSRGSDIRTYPDPTVAEACKYTWVFKNFEPGKTGPGSITVLWR